MIPVPTGATLLHLVNAVPPRLMVASCHRPNDAFLINQRASSVQLSIRMKTSRHHGIGLNLTCHAVLLAMACAPVSLLADQVPNPTVTASARPFNASFTAANLFDTAGNTEYASLTQGAVSAPFTTDPNNGTWVEMDFGSTVEFDRFVLRTRANGVDVIGQSRLIVSSDPIFDASDRIFPFDPTGANGAGPVRNLNELVSGRYARWEVITRTGSGLNLGGEQMWFLKTPAGHSLLAPPVVINSSPQFNASFAPANAANGDYGIEYASLGATSTMFIDFDFGTAKQITGFEFLNRWSDRVTTFNLIFADTADFSSTLATLPFTADANGNFVNSGTFAAVTARYVRLQATGFSGANNTGVREIQFFTVAGQPPTITQNPVGGTRLVGDAFTLSASALGDIPLSFQWLQNGSPILGATNSTLIFTSLAASNSGSYEVVASNPGGSATSAPPAVLTVLDPPIDIVSGLRLHLKFDETAGPVAIDDSGNARDGTLQGFPGDDSQWVVGRIDGAIRVNPDGGVTGDDVVLVADDGGLDFSSSLEFTLSAWVHGGATQEAGAPVFAKGTGGGGEQYALDVNGGAYRFYVRNAASGAVVFQSTNRPNDTWQHLVVVYSTPLNRVKFYVNGVETLSGTPSPTLLQNAHEVSLGSRQGAFAGGAYNLNFNGRIDDARIYGRVLTAADVTELYNQASLIPPSIVSAPTNTTLFALENAALTVVADGSVPLSYQWFKDGSSISNATNATLAFSSATTNDAGSYVVRVSNARGTTNSAPAVITVVDPAPNLANGLVLHLKLDETSGNVAIDSSGLAHDGTLQGFAVTPWTPGILDGALAFNPDGSAGDDAVLVPDDGTLDFASSMEFTLSAWANGDPSQEAGGPIICKGTGGGGEQFAIDVFNGYRFYGWTGIPASPVYIIGSPTGPDNTWQHIVGIFSRTLNRQKLFINGVEVAGGTPPVSIVQNSHEVSIGSRQGSAGPYDLNFNGKIDDVRIYNRAVTPREIKALNELGNLPRVTITRSGGNITITWPANVTGYVLESAESIPSTTWNPVSSVANNSVTLNAPGEPTKFFRLRKP